LGGEPFDVVIVGGGVVGCGAALDAATRGLDVALVEARDFASGTSSRSSKLLHGGLRYLEQGRMELVREALRERSLLMERLCPHLAHSVPILLPLAPRSSTAATSVRGSRSTTCSAARVTFPGTATSAGVQRCAWRRR
jgi:glycerol-3-phosphate dehydrogenase